MTYIQWSVLSVTTNGYVHDMDNMYDAVLAYSLKGWCEEVEHKPKLGSFKDFKNSAELCVLGKGRFQKSLLAI